LHLGGAAAPPPINFAAKPKAANFFHCLRFSPRFNIAFYRPLSMKFLDDFQVTVTF